MVLGIVLQRDPKDSPIPFLVRHAFARNTRFFLIQHDPLRFSMPVKTYFAGTVGSCLALCSVVEFINYSLVLSDVDEYTRGLAGWFF